MNTDNFTEAARAASENFARTPRMNVGTIRDRIAEAHLAGAEWARAYLAEQKPDVQHLWRPGVSPRAFCGDESARPRVPVPVTREESMAVPVCALCHKRAMHESYSQWAAQEPTDAEVEAAKAEAWGVGYGAGQSDARHHARGPSRTTNPYKEDPR